MITDVNPNIQPNKDPFRFILNGVQKDGVIQIENSIEYKFQITKNYTPIGSVYVGDNKIVIFSVSKDGKYSEIGIYNERDNTYTVHVNTDKLNFSKQHQIQAIFRIRRGCGLVIYWVDGYNKPRFYEFSNPDNFKDENGNWVADKFNIIEKASLIPELKGIEVVDTGSLKNGGYIAFIRYLDKDLNSTAWYPLHFQTVNIYNNGNDGTTSKSIIYHLDKLQKDYPFYQLAIAEFTSGNGILTSVKLTDKVNINSDTYTYTGLNYISEVAKEELGLFENVYYSAGSIAQVDNMLLLFNLKGYQGNLCKYQKYASSIGADLILKRVYLNDKNNPLPDIGYQPGEIYSFGIVYKMKDNFETFAYHIPGKNPNVSVNKTYTQGAGIYGMDNDNEHISLTYEAKDNCIDFWGKDIEGEPLEGKPVRFHKFPKRDVYNLPFIEKNNIDSNTEGKYVEVGILADSIDLSCQPNCDNLYLKLVISIDGVQEENIFEIDVNNLQQNSIVNYKTETYYNVNSLTVVSSDIVDFNGNTVQNSGITILTPTIKTGVSNQNIIQHIGYLYGIKFSNIKLPDDAKGYYIVRHKREKQDKIVKDTGVIFPTMQRPENFPKSEDRNRIVLGILGMNPEYTDYRIKEGPHESYSISETLQYNRNSISKRFLGYISPYLKFRKENISFNKISAVGEFYANPEEVIHGRARKLDIYPGTSWSEKYNRKKDVDEDGWSLKVINKDLRLRYKNNTYFDEILKDDIQDTTSLPPTKHKNYDEKKIINVSIDNRLGVLHLDKDVNAEKFRFPYVYFESNHKSYYTDFQLRPMLKITDELTESEAIVFNGDTSIQSIRMHNTVFFKNKPAMRRGKNSFLKMLEGFITILIGVAAGIASCIFAGCSGISVASAIIYAGLSWIAEGVDEIDTFARFLNKYEEKVEPYLIDAFISDEFRYYKYANSSPNGYSVLGPKDDEIQYYSETFTDLFFETDINISLRKQIKDSSNSFLKSPANSIEQGNADGLENTEYISVSWSNNDFRVTTDEEILPPNSATTYAIEKLVYYNSEEGKERYVLPRAEYYKDNPDFVAVQEYKTYVVIPYEYDCCTECREGFPHRVIYSQQSFSEELTDNYRVFLPNNYRDIPADTGEIKNAYIINNSIFVHTSDALWKMQKTYHERVYDGIVTFIGSGDYFQLPPVKVIDEYGNSVGLDFKYGAILSKDGLYFIYNKKIWRFSRGLKQIALGNDKILNKYFKKYGSQIYEQLTGKEYPLIDNTVSEKGIGVTAVHDILNNRYIFTKHDFIADPDEIEDKDAYYYVCNGEVYKIGHWNTVLNDMRQNGYSFIGIENCKAKFEKLDYIENIIENILVNNRRINRKEYTLIVNTGYLQTGCDSDEDCTILPSSIYNIDENCWHEVIYTNYKDYRWLRLINNLSAYYGRKVVFVNIQNTNAEYSGSTHTGDATQEYYDEVNGLTADEKLELDYANYLQEFQNFQDFIFIPIPITNYRKRLDDPNNPDYFHYVYIFNNFIYEHYKSVLKAKFGNNNIPNSILENLYPLSNNYPYFNFDPYKYPNLNFGYSNSIQPILDCSVTCNRNIFPSCTPENYEIPIINQEISSVFSPNIVYTYLDGKVVKNSLKLIPVTISISNDELVSFHSYHPSLYIRSKENFYGALKYNFNNPPSLNSRNKDTSYEMLKNDFNKIFQHNIQHKFGVYYNKPYDFIVEFVNKSKDSVTSIFDYVVYRSIAEQYRKELDSYVKRNDITFNKAILYNSKQNSGLIDLTIRKENQWFEDYIDDGTTLVSLSENLWNFSNFRDMLSRYDIPMFIENMLELDDWFIDKKLNPDAFGFKEWFNTGNFRDSYLTIRLIFSNFEDIKLLFLMADTAKTKSIR